MGLGTEFAAMGERSTKNNTIKEPAGRIHVEVPAKNAHQKDNGDYSSGDEEDEEEDYDSEEDYYSEEERESLAPGNTRPPIKKRRRKERIQRTGNVDLNLTENYGKKSNWGIREGVRELIQNFADNVRTNPDGTPREVEWVFEPGEKARVPTYIAYEKRTKPIRPDRKTGLHDRKKALGYMFNRLDEGLFVLVNHNTSLSRNVWSMGETSKGNTKHCIGGHGEGMKVGICALLRSGLQVSYYTNREIWEWHFRRQRWTGDNKNVNKLLIKLHPHKPRLAKRDPELHEDVRNARVSASKNTTVIVKARWMKIDFGDYLFLHPPTGDLQNTELGAVILDDKYRHKIFVKGIFIESRGAGNPPPLRYGIDFSQASLDRDRRSLMTHSEAANNIARMWNTIISRAPEEPTTQKYLELLLEEVDHLEVLGAEGFISLPSAQALLRKLVSLYPGAFFYSKEDKEISETIRIIRTCLAKQPKPISNRLYKILFKYKLLKTAQARREEIFVTSPPLEMQSDMWSKHTLHALKSALLLHPVLGNCEYEFYMVRDTVALNIVRVKDHGMEFKFHHRLLNFGIVHTQRESCRLFQSRRDGNTEEDAVCDCAVEELLDLLLSEIDEIRHDDKKHIKRRHKDLLDNMPRHVQVRQQEDVTDLKVEISWEVLVSEHFGTDFEVFVLSDTLWDTVRESHRYHKALNAEEAEDSQSPLSSDSSSPQPQPLNEAHTPSSVSQSISTTPKASEYIWNGKTRDFARTLDLPKSIPPGNNYIAVVRSVEQDGAFYSLPFAVNLPCPSPQDVFVRRQGPTISAKWTYFPFPAEFEIICTSIYDTLHTSERISGTSYEFNLEGSEEVDLEIQMFAVANGIQSRDLMVEVEAKRNVLEDTVEESCQRSCSQGPVPESTTEEFPSDSSSETYVSDEFESQGRDAEGESIGDGVEDDMFIVDDDSEGPEVESPGRLGGQEEVLQREEFQGRRASNYSGPRVGTPLLAIPSPRDDEETASVRSESSIYTPTFGLDQPSSSSNDVLPMPPNPALPLSLNQGSTCRVKLIDGITRIIQIHHHNQETNMLTVTNFLSESSLPVKLQDPTAEGEERLFMVYKNWMLAGEEADAEQLASSQILELFQDNIQIQKPGDTNDTSSSANTITYSVEWGIKVDDRMHEIRSLHNSKDNISNFQIDHEVLKSGNIAYYIGSGIPGWSVGFEKAGFTVPVATGLDEISSQTWKSNQKGVLYSEDVGDFLKAFPKRLQRQEVQVPTVLLLSTPLSDDSKPLDHGDDCEYLTSVSDAITIISPPMVFLSTSPKFFNSEHSKCLSKLYNTLLSNCYEFRLTIYDSSDYGTISSTKKSILFASRIGLRNPPGKPSLKKELTTGGSPFKANIEQHLVAQGFAKNFRVHGDSLSRKIHMIKDAVPPPMANAFGKFARDHMKELVSLTETMEQDCGSRKRKPEAEIVDRGNKRVR